MQPENSPVSLFYSYSHKDETLRSELEKHLSILRRQGVISEWHDRKITPGEEWADEIATQLETSQIILLLVSSDFVASDYCYDKEMARALERHDSGEARVLPIVLRSVDWKGAPFGKLQALPKDAKPVVSWEDRDEAFTDVAKGIRAAVAEVTKSARRRATPEIANLLKKFTLRPKKYAGRDFIGKVAIEDKVDKVDADDAQALRLTLGDAIWRHFKIPQITKYSVKLYAEGEMADWLEEIGTGEHQVRIRLLYGTHVETEWTEDGPTSREQGTTGYKLMEVVRN